MLPCTVWAKIKTIFFSNSPYLKLLLPLHSHGPSLNVVGYASPLLRLVSSDCYIKLGLRPLPFPKAKKLATALALRHSLVMDVSDEIKFPMSNHCRCEALRKNCKGGEDVSR